MYKTTNRVHIVTKQHPLYNKIKEITSIQLKTKIQSHDETGTKYAEKRSLPPKWAVWKRQARG